MTEGFSFGFLFFLKNFFGCRNNPVKKIVKVEQ